MPTHSIPSRKVIIDDLTAHLGRSYDGLTEDVARGIALSVYTHLEERGLVRVDTRPMHRKSQDQVIEILSDLKAEPSMSQLQKIAVDTGYQPHEVFDIYAQNKEGLGVVG